MGFNPVIPVLKRINVFLGPWCQWNWGHPFKPRVFSIIRCRIPATLSYKQPRWHSLLLFSRGFSRRQTHQCVACDCFLSMEAPGKNYWGSGIHSTLRMCMCAPSSGMGKKGLSDRNQASEIRNFWGHFQRLAVVISIRCDLVRKFRGIYQGL